MFTKVEAYQALSGKQYPTQQEAIEASLNYSLGVAARHGYDDQMAETTGNGNYAYLDSNSLIKALKDNPQVLDWLVEQVKGCFYAITYVGPTVDQVLEGYDTCL